MLCCIDGNYITLDGHLITFHGHWTKLESLTNNNYKLIYFLSIFQIESNQETFINIGEIHKKQIR